MSAESAAQPVAEHSLNELKQAVSWKPHRFLAVRTIDPKDLALAVVEATA
jgi:hypothetical protein